ncbi:MAG: DUF3800 domain-containing protein [Alphaproteobacteria bacterium]
MHLIYIDDSYERPYITFSAVAVPATQWLTTFRAIRDWRRRLKETDGIFVQKEFHATEFIGGRGRLGPKIITKYRRSQIFRNAFQLLNSLDGVRVFNVCRTSQHDWAFERLLTRIERTMRAWDSHALLVCDEGKELEYTRLARRMSVFNPIYRSDGSIDHVPLDRILEDPFFKESHRSYFVQMADFCAYGLLRREKPLASKNAYDVHKAFDLLDNVVVRAANPSDPMGVIR